MAKQFELGSAVMVKALRVVDGLDAKVEYIKQVVGKLTPHQYTSLHRELRMGRFVSMSGTPRYGETLKLTKVLRPGIKHGFDPLNPLGLTYSNAKVTSDAKITTDANDKTYNGASKGKDVTPRKINVHIMNQEQTQVDIFEKRDLVGLLDAKVDGNTLGMLDVRMAQHLNAIEDNLMRYWVWQIDGKVPTGAVDANGDPLEKWWTYDVADTNKVTLDLKTISNRDLFLLFVDGVTSFLKIRDAFTLKITKNDIVSVQGEEIKKRLILGEKEALQGGSFLGDKVYDKINQGELTKSQVWGVKVYTDNVMDTENANTGIETIMTLQLKEASMVFEEIMETYFGKVSVANNLDRAFYIRYAFGGENIYPEYIIKYVKPKAKAGEKENAVNNQLGTIIQRGMESIQEESEKAKAKESKGNEEINERLVTAIEMIAKMTGNTVPETPKEEAKVTPAVPEAPKTNENE